MSSTMNGQITIWEWPSGRQTGSIEGRRDIAGGRLEKDKVTAAHSASTKCFTSLCYTADGSCLLAGGRTKYGGSSPHTGAGNNDERFRLRSGQQGFPPPHIG